MPVSIITSLDPFATRHQLKVPQLRVLRALLPGTPMLPSYEWPLLTRAGLAFMAGYKPTSGSITRCLNGIRPGSSSGLPYLGLIALGMVEVVKVDVDGVTETNYRITRAGLAAYLAQCANGVKLPPLKDAASCVNSRYTSSPHHSHVQVTRPLSE